MAPTGDHVAKRLVSGKQPKGRVRRYLRSTEAQVVEKRARNLLLLRGTRCSNPMTTVLRDLRSMRAPHAKLLQKNNDVRAFQDEGADSIQFLCTKNDCSCFCVASNNKKRPNNLVLGRTYDRRVLDLVELGVTYYKSLADYASAPKKRPESKPLMHFAGDSWHSVPTLRRLQNRLVDLYRGDPVDELVLKSLDHVISFVVGVANEGGEERTTVHMRTHFCKLKKHPDNATDVPVPYLRPCGPDADFRIRRTQLAAPDVWRAALKQPKLARKATKKKNQKTNLFGETVGRLHVEKQDIDKMGGKKSKALKVAHRAEKYEEKMLSEAELEKEKKDDGVDFERTMGFAEVE